MTTYSSVEDILQDLTWHAESSPSTMSSRLNQNLIDLCAAAKSQIEKLQSDLEQYKKDADLYNKMKTLGPLELIGWLNDNHNPIWLDSKMIWEESESDAS